MKKQLLVEVRRMQKIAGLIKEDIDIDLSDTPDFQALPKLPRGWEVEHYSRKPNTGETLRASFKLPPEVYGTHFDTTYSIHEESPGKFRIHYKYYLGDLDNKTHSSFESALEDVLERIEDESERLETQSDPNYDPTPD